MMINKSRRGMSILLVTIAILTAIVSAVGVFMRGQGQTSETVTPRGEHYAYVTDGVYAYNAQRVVAEGVGWDIVTLCVTVPALLLCVPSVSRDSVRGRLFAVGVLGYLFYQYFEYAVTWAFGPLFLPFVAIYALSLVAAVWIVSTIDIAELPTRFDPSRFPRRGIAALCWGMAGLLVLMWLGRIWAGLQGAPSGALQGETTMTVQALDLGLVVPLCVWTGAEALRRSPIGYLLASTFLVMAVGMATAIASMLLSAAVVEGTLEIVPLAIFAGAALWAGALAWRVYRPVPTAQAANEASASSPATERELQVTR